MIKLRISVCLVLVLTIALGVWGWSYKDTYTDITNEVDYLDTMMVGEAPESIAVNDCEVLASSLPQVDYIFRVTASESIEHLYGVSQQKVVVQEVYAGDSSLVGNEIYITTRHWYIYIEDGQRLLGCGFVNYLALGKDYLVFCSEQVNTKSEGIAVYRIYEGSYITPVFCYADIENEIVAVAGMSTYVSYEKVKENEFFATTEGGLAAWRKLKKEMLNLFPSG